MIYIFAMRDFREPLYRVIARRIETRISAGEYAPGASLPTELALEREFGVSRITIRQALGLLKRRGLLYSRSGVGTLVRPDGPYPHSMRITGSLLDLRNYGAETEYTPVDRMVIVAPRSVAEALGLRQGARVFRFRGVRSQLQAKAFGFEEIYLPEPLGQKLNNVELGGRAVFSFLKEVAGVEIVEARQVITAALAPVVVSKHLKIPSGSPVLRVTRSYALGDGRTVEVAVSHYNVSKFQYAMTLYRE